MHGKILLEYNVTVMVKSTVVNYEVSHVVDNMFKIYPSSVEPHEANSDDC